MPRKPDNSLPASHTLCVGGTGSGKTSWIKRNRIKGERSIIVWDGKDEYGGMGFERITSQRALAARLARSSRGKIAYAPICTPENFAFWARAVWAWGHCLCIAEELADVTTPAKAPRAWGELIRKGRAHGVRSISTTQRPQEIDKTIIGNATDVMCGFLAQSLDRQYVSNRIAFDRGELDAMEPGDYVYRVLPRGEITRGRIITKKRKNTRKKAAQ